MSEPPVLPDPAAPEADVGETARQPVASGEPSTAAGVGASLRAAREARNMSIADAAQSLKLGPRQVEALEAENWQALPGNTMIRGFVRNYARLLGMDSDQLMHRLDSVQLQQTAQLQVSAGTSASLPYSGNRRVERRDHLAIIAGLLLLALALLAYFFLPLDLWQEKVSALLDRNTTQSPVQAPAAAAPAALPAASGESVTVLATPNTTVLGDAAAGARAIRLSFVRPAWVEIRDGRGQTVFSELGQAGSQRVVEGQPPFSLVVGNAANVSVEYQGKVLDLAQYSKGDVARLTLE